MADQGKKKGAAKIDHEAAIATVRATKSAGDLTEADLESRISNAIRTVAPWISAEDLRHQLTFSFQLGHKPVPVDGRRASRRQGRLDILIEHKGKHLAILELKEPGRALTQDDVAQGLSYARVLHPRPPIVVVANGDGATAYATESGEPLSHGVPDEAAVTRLFEAASKLAAGRLQDALATLMGPSSDVWVGAVRAATAATLDAMTGDWDDPYAPFQRKLHFPRTATGAAIDALRGSRRVVVVQGEPLVGKSHVLREVATRCVAADDLVILFVEAHGGAARGIVSEIARLLGDALGWPIKEEEVRPWLQRIAKTGGRKLVVAVDGLDLGSEMLRSELETLTARDQAESLKFLIEADTNTADLLWNGTTGRRETVFARRGKLVTVGTLSKAEFRQAVREVAALEMQLVSGAEHAEEYRQPWVFATLVASAAADPRQDSGATAMLPPMLSIDLIRMARERFCQDRLNEQAAVLARIIIDDYQRAGRDATLTLRSMHAYIVRKDVALQHATADDLRTFREMGLLHSTLDERRKPLLVARLPELVASEISRQLAINVGDRLETGNAAEAARYLADAAGNLPLGDIVGAHALIDLYEQRSGIPKELVQSLLDLVPTPHALNAGTKLAAWIGGIGKVHLDVEENGRTFASLPGSPGRVDISDDLPRRSYGNTHAWLLLSHLPTLPLEAVNIDDGSTKRFDSVLLARIGSSPVPLRRVAETLEFNGVHVHDLDDGSQILCDEDGIVEPITFALLQFFLREGDRTDAWIGQACTVGSAALMSRIALALKIVVRVSDDREAWAQSVRADIVLPALDLALTAARAGASN